MLYSGETVRIAMKARDVDNTRDLDGGGATPDAVGYITLYDSNRETLIPELPMIWNDEMKEWYYDWDTLSVPGGPGTYLAKVRVVGNLFNAFEYQRIRLARNPVQNGS